MVSRSVARSVAFKIVLMIKLVYVPYTRTPIGADKQTNSIPYYVTPYLEAVWRPTVRILCKLLCACSSAVSFNAYNCQRNVDDLRFKPVSSYRKLRFCDCSIRVF